jgi:hypothetical protein
MTSHEEQQAFRKGILAADITTTTALAGIYHDAMRR